MKKEGNSMIRRYFIFIVIFFLLFQIGMILPEQENLGINSNAAADSVCNKLSDGGTETTITFDTNDDVDTSARFSLPKGSDVLSASFKVKGLADNQDNYPSMVKVDVGDDGDPEWEFNITNVGAMGKQTEFIGSIQKKTLEINKGESDNSLIIRLPKSANILSVDLNIEGFFHGITNGDFESGDMTGWNIDTNQYSDTVEVTDVRNGNYPSDVWGATNYYLMLRSNPFNSHDRWCNIIVESDLFPKLFTKYLTMDWDIVDHDDFDAYIRIYDETNNFVTARFLGGDNNVNHEENLTTQVIDIQSLNGNYLNIYLRLRDGGGWSNNDWGRLAVDNFYISDDIGNPLPNYPTDVSIDVGSDGSKEYTSSSLTGLESITGLNTALNGLLANPSPACQLTTDKYGNEFIDIPLNVTILSSQGRVNISDLEIVYEYTAEVDKNPKGNLADELNSLIPSSGIGDVTIPIAVYSSTKGKLKISDINIQYNLKPTSGVIPNLEIFEDSVNPQVLDLTGYFSDDSVSEVLKFEVAANSAPDKLEAIIENDKYLTLNANITPDWYGDVSLVIRATDHLGLMVESNPFIVKVLPVNDEPQPKVQIPKVTLWEDSTGIAIDLDEISYFTDIEDDELYYSVKVDPEGIFPYLGSNLTVIINNNKELFIKPSNNWFGYNVPILLNCDDDKDPIDTGLTAPNQQVMIDVLPINDPPELEPFDTIYLDEDEIGDNILSLRDKATDIETPFEYLRFSILSNDNEENIFITIDKESNIDIEILTTDYVGNSKVKLQVEDEEGATADQSFRIIINPINDGPKIIQPVDEIQILEDTIDSTSLNLFDVFYDPDSPISFFVEGFQHVDVTISQDDGAVTFKPEKDWFGTENVVFSAIDSYLETGSSRKTVSTVIKIVILPVNDPPSSPEIISPLDPRTNTADFQVIFKSENAVDVDNSELFYYWDFDNRVDTNGDGDPTNDQDDIGLEVSHNYTSSGYYYITLCVSDGELNCTPPAGIFVKVTADFDEAAKGIDKKSSTSQMDLVFLLPFIILIIILVFWILFVHRKPKREDQEEQHKAGDSRKPQPPSAKTPVLEGEIVTAPQMATNADALLQTGAASTSLGSAKPPSVLPKPATPPATTSPTPVPTTATVKPVDTTSVSTTPKTDENKNTISTTPSQPK